MDMSRFSTVTYQYSLLLCLTFLLDHVHCQKTALMIKRTQYSGRDPIMLNTESFKKLIFNANLMIDHSLFIKEILEHPEKRIIIACPPKWSKSTNLHMIKMFLQMEIDDNGQQFLPINQTMVYRLFKYGEAFYEMQDESFTKPFLISKHQDIFDQHLCQYPVIHMRMRFVEGLNDMDAINNIIMMLRKVYTPHKYLLKVLQQTYKGISDDDKVRKEKAKFYYETFRRIMEEKETDRKVLANSLEMLCKLLYRQHRKRVVLLIDDYDLPFYKLAHLKHIDPSDMKFVMKFLEKIINPVIDESSPYVDRVIITGTYAFTGILGPIMNAIPSYTLLNNPWIEYFAVSDYDFELLCKQTGKTDVQIEQAMEWYVGYKIVTDKKHTFGQLFSVGNFLSSSTLRLYLFRYLEFDYVYRLVRLKPLRKLLERLVNGEVMSAHLPNNLVFSKEEVVSQKNIALFGSDEPLEHSTVDVMLSYLCATSYLTFEKSNVTGTYRLWIPNRESLIDIIRKLNAYYHKAYNISHVEAVRLVFNMRDYMVNNGKRPLAGIAIYLNNLFQSLDLYDPAKPQIYTVQYYQELMHDFLHYISLTWQSLVKTNSIVWKEPNSTALYMMSVKDNRGIISAVQYNQSTDRLMDMAKNQRYRLKKYKDLQFHKFIVFVLGVDRKVSSAVDSELITKG